MTAVVSALAVVVGLTVGVPALELIKEKTCAPKQITEPKGSQVEEILKAFGLGGPEK
jgi:hypothetical protein